MKVDERFLKYVSFETTSDEESSSIPSTPGQKVLGAFISEELNSLGLDNSHMDDKGYVYAFLPANSPEMPAIGFIAHMDTSPAVSGKNIKPGRLEYKGGIIELNRDIVIDPEKYEGLENYIGQELIITDGTTLLGADDKAGAAEIVTAMEYLINNPEIKHGKIAVGFTPDEEIGRGADYFDINGFGVEYAYTVDGGTLGEIEYENFNAASVRVTVHGLSTHTGSAKDKMINAIRIAAEFVSMLPADEIPEKTSGYEGFFHVDEMAGDVNEARINMLIRDHDMDRFLLRKELIKTLAGRINDKYGEGTFEAVITDSYYNMKEKILPVMHIVEKAKAAMRKAGVEPVIKAIRGGTDGARLSYGGLPCPNLSTGGENFHGIHEFVSVRSMEKMVEVIVNIASDMR